MTSRDDFQTIRAVLGGDREAYADLVRAYHPRILSLCLSLLLVPAEAEDAAQEVFVKAFVSLRQYKQNVSLAAWLFRIASNHCLDVLRKRKRQKTDSLDHLMENKEGQESTPFQPQAEATEDPARAKEDRLGVALKAMATLPPDYREILTLREVDDLSYEEIAASLQCTIDAVKARLHRARRQLQEKARHFMDPCSFSR